MPYVLLLYVGDYFVHLCIKHKFSSAINRRSSLLEAKVVADCVATGSLVLDVMLLVMSSQTLWARVMLNNSYSVTNSCLSSDSPRESM